MDFSITASVTYMPRPGWESTIQVPSFVLKNRASREEAMKVAEEIINPTRNPGMMVSVDAQPL